MKHEIKLILHEIKRGISRSKIEITHLYFLLNNYFSFYFSRGTRGRIGKGQEHYERVGRDHERISRLLEVVREEEKMLHCFLIIFRGEFLPGLS